MMADMIQVVRIKDGIECELARSRPLVEGGPYEIIVISDVPAKSVSMHNKLVLVPVDDVIELTEERRPNTYEEATELDPPAPHVRRRLFTDWVPVDGD